MKVGITGGIGSGKTIITKIFQTLGIPVFYADEVAKDLMQNDIKLVAAIVRNFGSEAYDLSGRLNKTYLASRVFKNDEDLETLNSLVHPVTIRAAQEWSIQQKAPYTLKEAALLFESGSYKLNDLNILVVSPLQLRIKRIMQRDGMPEEAVRARMDKQLNDDEKQKLADYVVVNDEKTAVIPQVLQIHHLIMERLVN